MESIIGQARLKVRMWANSHSHAALYDDESATLLDVESGKSVPIRWGELKDFEERVHPETGDLYIVLLFRDGRQLALADPGGVAFAPSTVNSGPLPHLPAVVCLKDFQTLLQRVRHYLHEHAEEAPPRECLDWIMTCIAILDGARSVGFDVSDLEGELEVSLREVERRTA